MSTDRNNTYKDYNPDILETIANLSNDEVFTPPKLANDILDLLPEEVWSDSTITFLDPAVKTGIFLREITSRLIDGLADEIPDLQERVNHILTKQVFGLGITELTSLMSRRTVYCSTTANGEYSICTEFDNVEGNIKFPDTKHNFDDNGRCEQCGANQDGYEYEDGKDNHAYSFIHDDLEEVFGNMKFDVIVGNPPYQMEMGNIGGNRSKSAAIYHLFVEKAMLLNPKYITMVIPSRWMNRSADGVPNEWIDNMTSDRRVRIIHDFKEADELFKGVGIMGGVNYFLWDKSYQGETTLYQHTENKTLKYKGPLIRKGSDIVVRDIRALSIIDKVEAVSPGYLRDKSKNFSSLVSPKDFFSSKDKLTSNWKEYSAEKKGLYNIKYYISGSTNKEDLGWVRDSDVVRNKASIKQHKLYIPAAHGGQRQVLGIPRYGENNSVCSQTYLVIGYDNKKHVFSKDELINIKSYIRTKFFRFMVKIKKITQNGPRGVYQFVPLQDWNNPWTDKELYEKYELTKDEIDYIEDNIDEML